MPTPESESIRITSNSVDETIRTGMHLGELLAPGDVICLSGDLGAGKTALARGIAAGWRALEAVTSPTFTLIHEHHRDDGHMLFHVDCYRLHGETDAWTIGLEDLLYGDGIVVIEWPENIAAALPKNRLWIAIALTGDTERVFTLTATGPRYQGLLDTLRS